MEVHCTRQLLADAPWATAAATPGRRHGPSEQPALPYDCRPPPASAPWCWRRWNAAPLLHGGPAEKIFTRINRYASETSAMASTSTTRFACCLTASACAHRCLVHRVPVDRRTTTAANTVADTYGTAASSCRPAMRLLYPGTSLRQVTPVTRGERPPASSGSKAWYVATSSAACCTNST